MVVQRCSGSLTTQPPPSRRRSIFGVFPAVSPLATHADLVLRELESSSSARWSSSLARRTLSLASRTRPAGVIWSSTSLDIRSEGTESSLSMIRLPARGTSTGTISRSYSVARGRDIQRGNFHDLEACRRSFQGDNLHGLEDRFCSVPEGQLAEWRILHVFLFADGEGSCTLRRDGFPEPLQDRVKIKNQQPLV